MRTYRFVQLILEISRYLVMVGGCGAVVGFVLQNNLGHRRISLVSGAVAWFGMALILLAVAISVSAMITLPE